MLPLTALLAVVLAARPVLTALSIVIGAAAALVQALGLVRWPFAVPELARRYVSAQGPNVDATRRTIEVTFATLHRLLGVGIGEHLGYLLTGLWTLLVAASILSTDVLPGWLGIIGLPIGVSLLVGTLEFVGPNERDGWPLAGTVVPIAYIAWSLWLIALGVFLILRRGAPVGIEAVQPFDSLQHIRAPASQRRVALTASVGLLNGVARSGVGHSVDCG